MRRLIFTALFLFTLVGTASAQYYNRMNGMSRMNRSMATQQTPRPEPEPKTPEDVTAERLPIYVEQFGLDPFKTEVLRSYLTDYYDKVFRLQKNEQLKGDAARKEYEFIENDFKENLRTILTEDEVNKFLAIDNFDKKNKKKRKSKKKDKDN
ncbi:MAG: hypothetical protein CL868_03630 [Cytophagaceae bacterium]|nr:hypothetical protein [Cytophagaceae bacterium]